MSHDREFTIRPPDGAASGWLEGTTMVAFSLPLGRIHATEECVVTMTSPVADDAIGSGGGGSRAVAVPLTVGDRIDSADTSGLPLDPACTTDGGFYIAHAAPATSTEGGPGGSGGRALQRCRWRDTYCGDNFGLRHAFTVTIRRPWYAKAWFSLSPPCPSSLVHPSRTCIRPAISHSSLIGRSLIALSIVSCPLYVTL